MNLVIRPEAEAEIAEAYDYYEAVSEGLGVAFLLAVEACLDGIERSPEMSAVIYKDVRRGLLRRFPYGIFYVVEQERTSGWPVSTPAAIRSNGKAGCSPADPLQF